MPGPTPTAEHGTTSRYRYGCRCSECRDAHSEASLRLKRDHRYGEDGPMGPKVRKQILRALKRTRSVPRTAEQLGMTHQAIYGACVAVPDFAEQVRLLTAPSLPKGASEGMAS
jgi:hypothetical protein